ncbi:MAG: DUF362 domain-containing protein [Bacteroidales bacterium]|nr:DUF362 domain-containing protein [Bacteroidales bacterium]
MYNPIPYLPKAFQKIISTLKKKNINHRVVFITLGTLATVWFLIRVIPKPSRASYPCMQATAPFMSGFVLYLMSLGGTIFAFNRFKDYLAKPNLSLALFFLFTATMLFLFSATLQNPILVAGKSSSSLGYFPPNAPIGEAKGIFPGRVVWMWDDDATNENCTNTSNNDGVIDDGDDAWFMAKNNNMTVIDSMLIKSLLALTGASTNAEAWEMIFTYHNSVNGNGNTGYAAGEKIFIKINATSAYGGLSSGKYYADLSRNDNLAVNVFTAETNPYVVLSMLRQLVSVAGVPQEMICVGDPARNIYKEFYDLWHIEFPDVKYLGNNLIHPELDVVSLGRTPVVRTTDDKVFFSDHGVVMPDAVTDKLFTVMVEMDYLINIPTMKAHATAGITLAAKNHFGSFTRDWAMHLHSGLMDGADDPIRLGYGLYRVQTDIMMHNLLSGKNLLMIVDGLYPSEEALAVPYKWESIPFEDDWCSSIFMSLDPVAIESVCHDFLRTEYHGPTVATSRPNWSGVDDYLHQAADSSLWPETITYDPDNDGVLIASLGVHEHWNDSLHKQYTRNLETGEGIELIKVHEGNTGIDAYQAPLNIRVFPNPTAGVVQILNRETFAVDCRMTDMNGKELITGTIPPEATLRVEMTTFPSGTYLIGFRHVNGLQQVKLIKN